MGIIKYYYHSPEKFYSLLSCINCRTVDTWNKISDTKYQCEKCECFMEINSEIEISYKLNKDLGKEVEEEWLK